MTWIALFLTMALAEDVSAIPEEAEQGTAPNRSAPPEVTFTDPFELDAPQISQLTDAVTIWHVKVPGVRKVAIDVVIHRGAMDIDDWPTHDAYAMGWAQDVATSTMTAEELEVFCDLTELELTSSMQLQGGELSLLAPRENLDIGLQLLEDVLKEPAFPKADVKRYIRDTLLYYLLDGPNSANAVANAATTFAWFPDDNPLGDRPDLKELSRVKQKGLIERHSRWLSQAPMTVLIVGDVDLEEIRPRLTEVFADVGQGGDRNPEPEVVLPDSAIIAIDMGDNSQSMLQLRMSGPLLEDPQRTVAEVVNFNLGGNFLSRLNSNLREDKGYTYGARSSYLAWHKRAHWGVQTEVLVENTAAAIGEIEKELTGLIEEGLTELEIAAARQSYISDWNETRQTASTAESMYSLLLHDQLDIQAERQRLLDMSSVTVEQSKDVANKYFGPGKTRLWVIAGDKEELSKQFDQLGWTPKWILADEAILGTF